MSNDEMMTIGELAELMDGRSAFYKFASNALLHEFTVEQIAQLKAMGVPEDASKEAKEAFATIHRYLLRAGADPRTDLAVDYATIFLSAGVYQGLTAEPYESVFTSEDNLMMQDARDDAVKMYRENGVDVDKELHMPEDHLGLELDFLAIMAGRTADYLRAADEGDASALAEAARAVKAQKTFVDKHILNWIDQLTEKVEEYADFPVYPSIMHLVRGQAQEDSEVLPEVAAALEGYAVES